MKLLLLNYMSVRTPVCFVWPEMFDAINSGSLKQKADTVSVLHINLFKTRNSWLCCPSICFSTVSHLFDPFKRRSRDIRTEWSCWCQLEVQPASVTEVKYAVELMTIVSLKNQQIPSFYYKTFTALIKFQGDELLWWKTQNTLTLSGHTDLL